MTDPKVSEKDDIEACLTYWLEQCRRRGRPPHKVQCFDHCTPDAIRQCEKTGRAIRAAIEERGRLREQIGEWRKEAGAWILIHPHIALFKELGDFKLDGEEEK